MNTTRIRLLTSVTGGIVRGDEGDVIDVPENVARVWCDGVRAERVRAVQPETATRNAPERAVAVENTAAKRTPEHATRKGTRANAAKRARGRG